MGWPWGAVLLRTEGSIGRSGGGVGLAPCCPTHLALGAAPEGLAPEEQLPQRLCKWGQRREALQSGHFLSPKLSAEEEISPRGLGQPVWGHIAISTLVYSPGPSWDLEHACLVPKLSGGSAAGTDQCACWPRFPILRLVALWQSHWARPDDLIRAVGELADLAAPANVFEEPGWGGGAGNGASCRGRCVAM